MKIIGIAGGSASGKSTFAARLQSQFSSCSVLAMDSYYKSENELPLVCMPNGKVYRDYNCPDSFVLADLKSDIRASLAKNTCEILLVEGLLTLWDDELCDMFDFRIFLDCPADIRIVRRMRRNLSWGLSFDEIADVYLDLVRERHEQYVAPSAKRADLILNTAHGVEPLVAAVLPHIL